MIEDDIDQAGANLDIIDISDSPELVKDIQDGTLRFYKDSEGKFYLNTYRPT